jgi:hypothetical protein
MPGAFRFDPLAAVLALLMAGHASAQQKVVKMPPPVNIIGVNASSPYISLDGKGLVFVSDLTEGKVPAVFYTSSTDEVNWVEPVMLTSNISSRMNYLRGFALSSDGKQLFTTSTKGGGAGGYDIYYSDKRGAFWSDPIPIGAAVNTRANEASPSVNADGTQLYFMRCERMDANTGSGCKLLLSTRRTATSQWTAPVELPPNINTGNSQTPRIMGDGETLIFSSDKLPGKGGMDLFLTRRQGDTWTTPVPLDFVNTPGNNQFVSATSTGRYLMTEVMGKASTEITQLLFPPEVKPRGVMKVEGRISGVTPPTAAYIALQDSDTRSKLNAARPEKDGSFVLYLKEGAKYTIYIDPEQDNYTFFAKDYDMTEGRINTMAKLDVSLKQLAPGDELVLNQVSFKPQSAELQESSQQQLDKVIRLMKGASSLKFSIDVELYGFQSDSVLSDPDLTEVVHDTIHFTVTRTMTDSTGLQVSETHDSTSVRTTYHNDRTVEQAIEVVNYLIGKGVPASGVMPISHVFVAVPGERKTLVKVIAR